MSLVEKALKKMESARAASAQAASARRTAEAVVVPEVPRPASREPQHEAPASQPQQPGPPVARAGKIVTINHAALRAEGLLPPEEEERRFAAEYRQIKRPLVAAARGRGTPPLPNGRVIMVTSAVPHEGKTFTSVNLALSLALEKNTTVLLVDGDFAKAHLSRTFGVGEEPGLVELLLNERLELGAQTLPTSVPGLSLLPAGRNTDTVTELIASARMERLVAEMLSRDPDRIVVFDSPPLLLTTESRALASVVGQIVMVVRAEETEQKAVLDALGYLGEGRPVGLVLNQSRSKPTHAYYGYGEYGESAGSGSRQS